MHHVIDDTQSGYDPNGGNYTESDWSYDPEAPRITITEDDDLFIMEDGSVGALLPDNV